MDRRQDEARCAYIEDLACMSDTELERELSRLESRLAAMAETLEITSAKVGLALQEQSHRFGSEVE